MLNSQDNKQYIRKDRKLQTHVACSFCALKRSKNLMGLHVNAVQCRIEMIFNTKDGERGNEPEKES